MAILNFVVSNIGQSGDIPTFVYFDTNDSLSTVVTAGYLNKFVAQGNSVSDYNMALVSVLEDDVQSLQLCSIVFSDGNWSLVQYNGNPFPYIELVNSLGDTITLQAPATSFTDVTYTLPPATSVSGYVLSSTTAGVMSWIANGSGGGVSGAANVGPGLGVFYQNSSGTLEFYSLSASAGVTLSSGVDDNILIGFNPAASFNGIANPAITGSYLFEGSTFGVDVSGAVSVQGTSGITLPALASGSTADVIYYNSSTGYISYAPISSSNFPQNNVTTATQALAVNNGYITNDSSAQVVYTLPSTAAIGAVITIAGNSADGWSIHQNAGQNIQVGSISTTAGTGGSVTNTNAFDCISLICTVANTTFVSTSVVGNLTIV